MGIEDSILKMLGELPQSSAASGSSAQLERGLLLRLDRARSPPPTRVGAVATIRVVTRALTPPIPWDILLEKSPRRAGR